MSISRARRAQSATGADPSRARARKRHPLRRLAATVAAVLLGAGLSVVGAAAPASAHHATVGASYECNPETGAFDITWTVNNSERNKTAEVTASSNKKVVAVGTKLGKAETKSFVQRGVAAGTYSLEVELDWDGARPDSDSKTITVKGDCGGGSGNDKVCDPLDTGHLTDATGATHTITAPEGKLIAEVCVKAGSIKQGQGPEYTTIDPPSKTVTISHSSKKDISHYSVRYVDDHNWSYAAPTCEALTVIYPKGVTGNDVNIRVVLDGQRTTLNFHNNDGRWSGTQTFVYASHANWPKPAPSTWTIEWVQVDGTNYHWEGEVTCGDTVIPAPDRPGKIDECGVLNDAIVLPADTAEIAWTVEGDPKTGSATAVATAKDGFVFPGGAATARFPFAFTNVPCVTELEWPTAPQHRDVCGAGDEIILPPSTAQIVWTIEGTPASGAATAVATAQPGYAFPGGATVKRFDFTFTDVPCPVVIEVPAKPAAVDVCGVAGDQVLLPGESEQLVWRLDGDVTTGAATAVATAKPGFQFADGTTERKFAYTFTDEPCPVEVPVPAAAASEDVCGVDDDRIVLPADTDQVTWTIEGDETEGAAIAVATTTAGFEFEDGSTTKQFAYEFSDEPCAEPSLAGSIAAGTCLANAPWIVFDVVLTDPDAQSTSRLVKLVLSDGTNSETLELGELDENGKLSGRILWPGASVDEQGNPTGWPGWEQTADGFWVETDGNYAWTRSLTSATLQVNPELGVGLAYPPATPNCLSGPGGSGSGDGSALAVTGQGKGLASTGFAGATIAIVAGIIVVAGVAFLVIARLRRNTKA
ncbi:hypothetical protein ABIQ69_10605 [Agromyces sp. G08B096]|uniref:Uncharacterized protein n=1 Tax=Agromyces sp. G08B096 TaxID=3156399 RepID=A0AAU7W3N6_9MICO